MLSKLKSILPNKYKKLLLKYWHQLRPPRINLNKFIKEGAYFEITTKMEKYRISNYGDEIKLIENFLEKIEGGDVFFDIGSCLGLYAIHAAHLGCKVFAFEPDPGYRKRLKKNIRINKLKKKVNVLNWAVSNNVGTATLYSDGINGNSPSLVEVGSRDSILVKTNTIDNAIANGELPSPDIIKIDIEGAEFLALRGMERTLGSEHAPRLLFIEFHPRFLPSFNSTISECKHLIFSKDYKEVFTSTRNEQFHSFFIKEIS